MIQAIIAHAWKSTVSARPFELQTLRYMTTKYEAPNPSNSFPNSHSPDCAQGLSKFYNTLHIC